jgi:hypothetical protein
VPVTGEMLAGVPNRFQRTVLPRAPAADLCVADGRATPRTSTSSRPALALSSEGSAFRVGAGTASLGSWLKPARSAVVVATARNFEDVLGMVSPLQAVVALVER